MLDLLRSVDSRGIVDDGEHPSKQSSVVGKLNKTCFVINVSRLVTRLALSRSKGYIESDYDFPIKSPKRSNVF